MKMLKVGMLNKVTKKWELCAINPAHIEALAPVDSDDLNLIKDHLCKVMVANGAILVNAALEDLLERIENEVSN